jgi:hypothetical protein
MTLARPTARLTVDGHGYSAAEAAVHTLRLEIGVSGAHDALSVLLGPGSPVADVAAGADLSLALGYGDRLEDVLTGKVSAIDEVPGGVALEALAASASLSRTRVAQSYLQQTVADIVHDLLGRAEVDAGKIDAPLKLAAYHVDERRTTWAFLLDLARLASCEIGSDPAGALDFRPPRSGPTADHSFRHGADLLGWSVGPRGPRPPDPDVVPYGAASEEGSDKWHLLLREPDGGSPSGRTLVPPPVRDRDGARALRDGLAKASRRRGTGGVLLVVGEGALRPGDVIELTEMPGGDGPLLRARAVTHMLDPEAGFVTRVAVEGVA